MADEKLIFDILQGQNNVLDALKGIQNQAKIIDQSLGDVKKGLDNSAKSSNNFLNSFKSLAALLPGLIAGFSFKKAIEEAIESEDAVNRLNAALEATGQFSEEASKDLQNYAEAVQQTTRFSDDQVISNLALLQSLGNFTKNGLKVANDAALNLASALRIDLDSATKLIGKAANGNTEAFTRYGISIRKGRDDAESLANTLQALSKFQDRASKDADSFGGAIAKSTNAFSNLLEELGKIITQSPEIIKFVNGLADVFNGLAEETRQAAPVIQKFFGTVTKSPLLNLSPSAFSAPVSGFTGEVKKADEETKKLEKSFTKLNTTITKTGASGKLLFDSKNLQDQITAATKAFDTAFKNPLQVLFQDIQPQAISRAIATGIGSGIAVFNNVARGAQGAAQLLGQAGGALASALTGIPGLGDAVSGVIQFLSQGPEKVRAIVTDFFKAIPELVKNIFLSFAEIQSILPDLILNAVNGIIAALPEIIVKMVESFILQTPRIINALIANLPRLVTSFVQLIPQIVQGFIKSFSENIPQLVAEIGRGVAEAIKGAVGGALGGVGDFFGGIGKGVGNIVGGVGDFLGFQEGGRIPNIASLRGDGAIAKVNAGEQILNRDLTSQLEKFLQNPVSQGLSQPMVVNLMIGERQLAKVNLDLNRRGFRTA